MRCAASHSPPTHQVVSSRQSRTLHRYTATIVCGPHPFGSSHEHMHTYLSRQCRIQQRMQCSRWQLHRTSRRHQGGKASRDLKCAVFELVGKLWSSARLSFRMPLLTIRAASSCSYTKLHGSWIHNNNRMLTIDVEISHGQKQAYLFR